MTSDHAAPPPEPATTPGGLPLAAVEPLDTDGVRTTLVGTLVWLIGFVALLPFYGRLADAGRTWWLWTCLAGCGLGLLGLEYCRRRRTARLEHAVDPSDDPPTSSMPQ